MRGFQQPARVLRMRCETLTTILFLASAAPALALTAPLQELAADVPVQTVLPPGYTELAYDPPAPGSYSLPPLGRAGDGTVLNGAGEVLRLHSLYGDRLVLLTFMYTRCSDIHGCPLATTVFFKIRQALKSEPALAQRLRLISLSFDPEHDTPAIMRQYAAGLQDAALDWQFLTTASHAELDPILASYNQSIQPEYDAAGEPLGSIAHILRVFLIDRDKRIRNIYSVSFLHPDVLINDLKTLLLVDASHAGRDDVPAERAPEQRRVHRPGDDKAGYETADYVTDSVSLVQRRGKDANLLGLLKAPPLGLPPVPVPPDNPVTRAKIELGRKLFYDRRLSLNHTFSCAMCHIPEQGFTSNEMATAVGIEGRSVRRNAPTLYNTAYLTRLFHDGREFSLEQQIWGPLLATNEMGNPSVGAVIETLRRLPDYQGRFETAFAGQSPSMETLGMALASYERALVSANSPFDRWYFGGQDEALGASARRGFELFAGDAGCVACHTIDEDHALFTDNELHNTGIGYAESMAPAAAAHPVMLAPGVRVTLAPELIGAVSGPRQSDLGLYEVTQDPDDRWKYRTPSLRNVALTAPYMHNGSLATLRDVLDFYHRGGHPNPLLDARIRPLDLTNDDLDDLLAFLESLTGDNIDTLVSDAFAAPIGN